MVNKKTNNMSNTNTNAKTDWKKNELGALWKRESKGGEKYLTGTLKVKEALNVGQELQVIIFSNKSKKADNHPDFNVYISEKNASSTNTSNKQPTPAAKTPVQEESGEGLL